MIDTYLLAIKYWMQGDSWHEAVEYAKALTHWTRRPLKDTVWRFMRRVTKVLRSERRRHQSLK